MIIFVMSRDMKHEEYGCTRHWEFRIDRVAPMNLSVSIDLKKFYSIFILTGDISFGDLRKELDCFSNNSSNFHRLPMVWDLRQADLSKTSRKHLDKIAEYFDQQYDIMDTVKVACVVDTDLQYGLCRMLQVHMNNNMVEIKTFKDYRDAIQWINA